MRSDIADVRLAHRVFAPHYAEPVARTVTADTTLRDSRGEGSSPLVRLERGAAFDLLDVTGGVAWGVARDAGLVGYLDAAALGPTE